jgi:hypothetical protein
VGGVYGPLQAITALGPGGERERCWRKATMRFFVCGGLAARDSVKLQQRRQQSHCQTRRALRTDGCEHSCRLDEDGTKANRGAGQSVVVLRSLGRGVEAFILRAVGRQRPLVRGEAA